MLPGNSKSTDLRISSPIHESLWETIVTWIIISRPKPHNLETNILKEYSH